MLFKFLLTPLGLIMSRSQAWQWWSLALPLGAAIRPDRISARDGTSLNQFLVIAAAEKVAAIETEQFFEERKNRADRKAFRRILNRKGGEPPRIPRVRPTLCDEMPAFVPARSRVGRIVRGR
jgi:hypothetical protein